MRFGAKTALVLSLLVLASCTKQAANDRKTTANGDSESYPLENSKLKNCRFKFPNPSYTFGATIEPNTILCDEGVPRKVEKLSPAALPSGIQFVNNTLSLTGFANERVVQAPYEFYLENESGYVIIKIQISIQ